MSRAKLYSIQIHRREMNRCGHFFNQNKTARKCQTFGYMLTLPDAGLKLTYAEYSFV